MKVTLQIHITGPDYGTLSEIKMEAESRGHDLDGEVMAEMAHTYMQRAMEAAREKLRNGVTGAQPE